MGRVRSGFRTGAGGTSSQDWTVVNDPSFGDPGDRFEWFGPVWVPTGASLTDLGVHGIEYGFVPSDGYASGDLAYDGAGADLLVEGSSGTVDGSPLAVGALHFMYLWDFGAAAGQAQRETVKAALLNALTPTADAVTPVKGWVQVEATEGQTAAAASGIWPVPLTVVNASAESAPTLSVGTDQIELDSTKSYVVSMSVVFETDDVGYVNVRVASSTGCYAEQNAAPAGALRFDAAGIIPAGSSETNLGIYSDAAITAIYSAAVTVAEL